MLNPGILTFREFVTEERLPLSWVHEAVLDFLRGRSDGAVLGAYAVNAYVDTPRMTQDVDLACLRAQALATELRDHLHEQLSIAVRIREAGGGRSYRLDEVRDTGNRHLVDITQVERLPATREVTGVAVAAPEALVASKVVSYHRRRGQPKAGSDWRDIAELLLVFPELKADRGPVADALVALDAPAEVLGTWQELVAQRIEQADDDSEFL